MAFRTLIIDSHSKLEYSLEYLIFRTPESTKRILLSEIHTLIIQSTAVSITTSLIAELIKKKIKVIFCDEKKNPISELTPFYNAHNSSGRIFEQINWDNNIKDVVWKHIVIQKIKNQSNSLFRKGKKEEAKQLLEYSKEVEIGDVSNREGHAAKVYFHSIFFEGFNRDLECDINTFLDYGYTVLLSQFNRTITSYGYLTQLGIHHINEFNQFNLSCDLIEPFRFIIDDNIDALSINDNWKDKIVSLLSLEVIIDEKKQTVVNAINIYCQSVFTAIKNKRVTEIKFINNDI